MYNWRRDIQFAVDTPENVRKLEQKLDEYEEELKKLKQPGGNHMSKTAASQVLETPEFEVKAENNKTTLTIYNEQGYSEGKVDIVGTKRFKIPKNKVESLVKAFNMKK